MQFGRSAFIGQPDAGSIDHSEAVLHHNAGGVQCTFEPGTVRPSQWCDGAREPGYANRWCDDYGYVKCREYGEGGNHQRFFDGSRQRLHSDNYATGDSDRAAELCPDSGAKHAYVEGWINC